MYHLSTQLDDDTGVVLVAKRSLLLPVQAVPVQPSKCCMYVVPADLRMNELAQNLSLERFSELVGSKINWFGPGRCGAAADASVQGCGIYARLALKEMPTKPNQTKPMHATGVGWLGSQTQE